MIHPLVAKHAHCFLISNGGKELPETSAKWQGK